MAIGHAETYAVSAQGSREDHGPGNKRITLLVGFKKFETNDGPASLTELSPSPGTCAEM